MVLFGELGRALGPGPWLGTVLAAHALADGDARAELDAVVAGELRVAVCVDPWGGPLTMRGDRISGTRETVLGAGLADGFLVIDATGVLFVAKTEEVTAAAVPSLDASNPIGTVAFRDARCTVLARDAAAAAA